VAADTTAAEIVAAYFEAIGGIEAIKAIEERRMRYTVFLFGREPYQMEQIWTRPNRLQMGEPGDPSYLLTVGEESWQVTSEGRDQLPASAAESLRWMADIDGPLVDSFEKGVTLEYTGVVPFDMVGLRRVTATFPSGHQWEYLFDPTTGLLRKLIKPSYFLVNDQITRGPDSHLLYYDYHSIAGVLYPRYWIQAADDHVHLFVADEIEIR